MTALAKLVDRHAVELRRFKPTEMVQEIAQSLHDELDLLREGANASQLKRNFAGSNALYIPTIYWNYSTNNVLVMERIHGIPIHNIHALKSSWYKYEKIGRKGH